MFRTQNLLSKLIWSLLLALSVGALLSGKYSLSFLAALTFLVSIAPLLVARWAEIIVPPSFIAAVVVFTGGTMLLGEAYDFYNIFWWWDILLHGGSAVGFGLIGFVLVFMMFQGDRFAAPHFAIAVFAFCFAMALGVMWEIFEFLMDLSFGLTMQKSGLLDTMGDLIVDMMGAFFGAASGYGYLKGRDRHGLSGLIGDFVRRNPRFFGRFRK